MKNKSNFLAQDQMLWTTRILAKMKTKTGAHFPKLTLHLNYFSDISGRTGILVVFLL